MGAELAVKEKTLAERLNDAFAMADENHRNPHVGTTGQLCFVLKEIIVLLRQTSDCALDLQGQVDGLDAKIKMLNARMAKGAKKEDENEPPKAA